MSLNIEIADKYKIFKRIGQGAFGSVFKAECLKTKKIYAAKLETPNISFSTVKHEASILHYLNSQKCTHLPYIYYYGLQTPYVCMIITYYEGSLEELGSSMSVYEKMKWWNTMIKTLERIHKAGIVHRDIKPAHFMKDSNQEWNLIDFGLATSFLKDSHHIEEIEKENIVGSPSYVSFHVHEGKDVVQRDDFISLVYIFWELIYGSFIPSNQFIMREETEYKKEHILHPFNQWLKEQKQWTRLYQLQNHVCGDVCSDMIVAMLTHGQFLKFKDRPNYDNFAIEFSIE